MNYARIDIPLDRQEAILTATAQKLGERTGLKPVVDMETDTIILKENCVIPFFTKPGENGEPDQIEFYSVDSHGLPFNPPEAKWAEYRQAADLRLDTAITYLGALFKALLCETADTEIDDDGAGKYREDPNLPKFKSLPDWKTYIRSREDKRQFGGVSKLLDRFVTKERAKIDKIEALLLPEIAPQPKKEKSGPGLEM